MRIIVSFIMLCMTMVIFASAQKNSFIATELVTDVIIVRDAPASIKPRMPERDPLVFYGYVVEPMNSLVLSSNLTVNADVYIENLASGDYAEYTTSITTTPVFLDLMGSGSYHLTISLAEGETYSGDFDL